MATSIVMPQMGYDMHEGKVVRWLKKEGEEVTRGEVIAEIAVLLVRTPRRSSPRSKPIRRPLNTRPIQAA